MTRLNLENAKVNVNCPKCDSTNRITLGQVRRQETVICPGCGAEIQLVDQNGGMARGLDDINRALDDLRKTIRKFGR